MRRTSEIEITREGRDKGDVVGLREMPALPATEWFVRAMQLLVRSGADVPSDIMSHGVSGFITIGVGTILTGLGKAPWFEVKPLLDELLTCVVSYRKAGATVPMSRWDAIKNQIEEPSTILQLYEEVVSLHLGFSLAVRLSSYREMAAMMMTGLGLNTETSTESQLSSSEGDSRP